MRRWYWDAMAAAGMAAHLGAPLSGCASAPVAEVAPKRYVGSERTHAPYEAGSPPDGSPVAVHGPLRVEGPRIVDQMGTPVQLRGVSSMWLNWEDDGYALDPQALVWMRDQWRLQVIRAAMGVEVEGAYLERPVEATAQVDRIVQNAIAAGVYVIIDWHTSHAEDHQADAQAFFAEMAEKYGAFPNVLYETYNEPLEVLWHSILKPYHRGVVEVIRERDPDNIIVLGTPRWSQSVVDAALDPLEGTNLAYTLHFYSCTHGLSLRADARRAASMGLPLLVTEWGATDADGGLDGKGCVGEADTWLDWLDTEPIGWVAWKLDDCEPDSSCILRPGAPLSGGWTNDWLSGHGPYVRDRLLR